LKAEIKMPLSQGKSKKAFSKNVATEMNAGKPMKQSLAIAYSVKKANSKKKKMAEGGSVRDEKRPMPDDLHDDKVMANQNRGNKAAKDDSWTDRSTVVQAQSNNGRTVKPIKQPKMVPSNAFSVRMRDEEADLQDSAGVNDGPQRQPLERDNEEGPDRQGDEVPDMQDEHSTHRKPYAKGGMIDDMDHPSKHDMQPDDSGIQEKERHDESDLEAMEAPSEDEGAMDAHKDDEMDQDASGDDVPDMEHEHSNGRKPYAFGGSIDDEAEEEHHDSIAAAIMARRERMHAEIDSGAHDMDSAVKMAEGGNVSNSDKIINRNIKRSSDPELAKKNIKDFQESANKKPKKYAEGGDIHSHDSIYSDDSSQADLSRNADEDANEEDQLSFNALRKENYNESEGLAKLDSPRDSNEYGDDREDESENKHDKISAIRARMNMKRQFSK
jgi:hypothetical protein